MYPDTELIPWSMGLDYKAGPRNPDMIEVFESK